MNQHPLGLQREVFLSQNGVIAGHITTGMLNNTLPISSRAMNHTLPHGAAYPLGVGGELAMEHKALHTCLQAWNIHHLHKVALHYGQLLWLHQTLVLGMLPL